MTFKEKFQTLTSTELADILNLIGLKTRKPGRESMFCSCPIGGDECLKASRCTLYFNTMRIECLHAGHGGISLYELIIQSGFNPKELLKDKDFSHLKPVVRETVGKKPDPKKYKKLSIDLISKIRKNNSIKKNEIIKLLEKRRFSSPAIEIILAREYLYYLTAEDKKALGVKNASDKHYNIGFPTLNGNGYTGFNMWIADGKPDKKFNPKYKYTPGSSLIMWDYILNKEDSHKRLFIIEGAFDALRLITEMELTGAAPPYAFASMPAKLSIERLRTLKLCESVYFFPDNDHAGKSFIINNIDKCDKKVFVCNWSKHDKAKGIDEFLQRHTLKELKNKIQRVK